MRMSAGSLGSDREQHERDREGAEQEGERFAKQLHNLICRCEMAGPPRSEHDAAESAKRAGMAKYADSLLLYCSSRVVKTKRIILNRLSRILATTATTTAAASKSLVGRAIRHGRKELRIDPATGLNHYHTDRDFQRSVSLAMI